MAKKRSTKSTASSKKQPETTPEQDGWKVVGNVWDEMFLFETPGDEFTGVYLSTGHDIGPNRSQVHIFADGVHRIGIWGSSALDQRMQSARTGHMTRIRYDALALASKSNREYKDFQVWQMEGLAPGYSAGPDDDIPF